MKMPKFAPIKAPVGSQAFKAYNAETATRQFHAPNSGLVPVKMPVTTPLIKPVNTNANGAVPAPVSAPLSAGSPEFSPETALYTVNAETAAPPKVLTPFKNAGSVRTVNITNQPLSGRPIMNRQLGEFNWGDFLGKALETVKSTGQIALEHQAAKQRQKYELELAKYQLAQQQQNYFGSGFNLDTPNYSPIYSTGNTPFPMTPLLIGGGVLLAAYLLMSK